MSRYLLDTNHLSPLVTIGHPLRTLFLNRIESDQFFICTPVLTEFLFGIGILPRAQENNTQWETLRTYFTMYELSEEIAVDAARLQINLRRKGWQLQTVDAQIAAIALVKDLTLLTTDRDFSAVPHLETENWLA